MNSNALQLSADSDIEAKSTKVYKSAILLEAYLFPVLEITLS